LPNIKPPEAGLEPSAVEELSARRSSAWNYRTNPFVRRNWTKKKPQPAIQTNPEVRKAPNGNSQEPASVSRGRDGPFYILCASRLWLRSDRS